jgi:hypothetical protein
MPERLGEPNGLFVQTAIAALVSFLQQRFPSNFQLHQVVLSECQSGDAGPYEQFFDCPIVFGSTTPGIAIDDERASQPERGTLPQSVPAMQNQQEAAFAEIALLPGFSEQSAFNRVFENGMGSPPGQFNNARTAVP